MFAFQKLAVYSVRRRKLKNSSIVSGVSVAVMLVIGTLISISSISPFLVDSLTRDTGYFDVAYGVGYSDRNENRQFNDTQRELLENVLSTYQGVVEHQYRYVVPVNNLEGNGGRFEPNVPFIGINENPTEVSYMYEDGSTVDFSALGDNEIVIGNALSKSLNLKAGDSVDVYSSFGNRFLRSINETGNPLLVSGVLQDGGIHSEHLGLFAITSLSNIYDIYQLPPPNNEIGQQWVNATGYTEVAVKFTEQISSDASLLETDAYNLALAIAEGLRDDALLKADLLSHLQDFYDDLDSGSHTELRDLRDVVRTTNSDRLDALRESSFYISQITIFQYIFGAVISIAALFVIASIQAVSFREREESTALFLSLGATRQQIAKFFVSETLVLSLLASVIGFFLGIIYSWFLIQGFSNAFGFSGIPISVSPTIVVISVLVGAGISMITALYPSYNASSLNIIAVLKGGFTTKSEDAGVKVSRSLRKLIIGIVSCAVGAILLVVLDGNPFGDITEIKQGAALFYAPSLLIFGIYQITSTVFIKYETLIKRAIVLSYIGLLAIHMYVFTNLYDTLPSGVETSASDLVYMLALIGASLVAVVYLFYLMISAIVKGLRLFTKVVPIFGRSTGFIHYLSLKRIHSQRSSAILVVGLYMVIIFINLFIGTFSQNIGTLFQGSTIRESADSDIVLINFGQGFTDQDDISKLLKDDPTVGSQVTEIVGFSYASTLVYEREPELLQINDTTTMIDRSNYEHETILLSGDEDDLLFENNTLRLELLLDNVSDAFTSEGEGTPDFRAWKAVLTGEQYSNELPYPVVIQTSLFLSSDEDSTGEPARNTVGDLVYFEALNGTPIPFVYGGEFDQGSPISETFSVLYSALYGESGRPGITFIHDSYLDQIRVTPTTSSNSESDTNMSERDQFFLIQTSNDLDQNNELAGDIESLVNLYVLNNNLTADPRSLTLQISQFEGLSLQFEDFLRYLQFSSTVAISVGVFSLLIISIRSIIEQRYQIGLVKAVGVSRYQLIATIFYEIVFLTLLSFIGALITGISAGYFFFKVLTLGLSDQGMVTTFAVNWSTIFAYGGVMLSLALIVVILPSIIALRVEPIEALRHKG